MSLNAENNFCPECNYTISKINVLIPSSDLKLGQMIGSNVGKNLGSRTGYTIGPWLGKAVGSKIGKVADTKLINNHKLGVNGDIGSIIIGKQTYCHKCMSGYLKSNTKVLPKKIGSQKGASSYNKPICKFGKKCKRKGCWFNHPEGQASVLTIV